MKDVTTKSPEEVVNETINAYRVQKMADGHVRFKKGGHVVNDHTYFEALERYAQWMQEHIEERPDHIREDRRQSIYDGMIALRSYDSDGFTPEQILDEVTGHPLEIVLDDLAVNSDHDDLCWCHECTVESEDE